MQLDIVPLKVEDEMVPLLIPHNIRIFLLEHALLDCQYYEQTELFLDELQLNAFIRPFQGKQVRVQLVVVIQEEADGKAFLQLQVGELPKRM